MLDIDLFATFYDIKFEIDHNNKQHFIYFIHDLFSDTVSSALYDLYYADALYKNALEY